MPFRRKSTTAKAKEAVAEQVNDRTDDLVAALDAARRRWPRPAARAPSSGPSWASRRPTS